MRGWKFDTFLYSSIAFPTFLFFFKFNREFADAKVCLKETVDVHCHFDGDAAEILQSAFDDYNPFCSVSLGEEGRRSASVVKQQTNKTTHEDFSLLIIFFFHYEN